MRQLLLITLTAVLPSFALAESISDFRQIGESLANSKHGDLISGVKAGVNQQNREGDKVGDVLNFQGTAVAETKYNDANIYDEAKKMADNEKNDVAIAVKDGFLRGKEFEVELKDSFLDKARDVEQNPQNYVDFLTGKYSDCQVKSEDITSREEVICDDYTKYNEHTCSVGREVVVDAKHNYLCHKKRNQYNKACERELKLTCEKSKECDSGGIILTSMASDMKWEYKYPYLVVGTIADNYWSGSCARYDRTTTFEVRNKDLIKEFSIIAVGFDDHMRISVNDTQVYIGPYGGNKLEVTKVKRWNMVTTGKDIYNCELGTNWNFNTNIDLRPFLREGKNTVRIEVIVSGHGEGWMKIKTVQHCCEKWQEEWVEICGGKL